MIAYLQGTPKIVGDKIIIQTGGVGYGVLASQKTINDTRNKSQLELFIYTHVKEDRLELYGFVTFEEQQLFEMVLGISGIGPATALAIIDHEAEQLVTAVQEANVAFFKSIPRIGKKMAQKIIIDLRGKLGELKELNLAPLDPKQQTVADALTALGWDDDAVQQAVTVIDLEKLSVQEAIKLALKKIN